MIWTRYMFNKAGILELHATTHERLDLLLRHIATVPEELLHQPISGFGRPTIWRQLVHILTCEDGWIHDLQNKAFAGWSEEDCPTMTTLLNARDRTRAATRTYLDALTEEQLNTTLTTRPIDWGGELRSPAFILLHVITHAFHHKGQIVAMLRIVGYPAPDTDLQPV
ncbi:MAG: DinB family protein [Acidobacteriaceae bacterium]